MIINTYAIHKPFWTKRTKIVAGVWFFIALAGILLYILVSNKNSFWVVLVFILLALLYVESKLSNAKEEPYIFFTGKITFDVASITIDQTTYQLNSLQKLVFQINNWDNQPCYAGKRITYYNGINNFFQFVYNNTPYTIQFYIDSEIQFDELLQLFSIWYANGVDLTEKNSNGDFLLLHKAVCYLELAKRKRYIEI